LGSCRYIKISGKIFKKIVFSRAISNERILVIDFEKFLKISNYCLTKCAIYAMLYGVSENAGIEKGKAMSKVGTKPVHELLGMNFFIPSYQRGYRWTKREVQALLKDIDDFKPKEEEWYCLQPLVVKKLTDKEKEQHNLQSKRDNNNWYEVVDGQQRLTTIFLIIHYANEMWEGKDKIPEPTINYKTRQGDRINSFRFLEKIKVEEDTVKIDDSNIDYYHISNAFSAIHEWVKDRRENGYFERDKLKIKFQQQTRVIWYETEQDGRDIFTRINVGKIPLSNAELIKALFLNSSNFKAGDEERIRLQQLEIASEWDNIEYTLSPNFSVKDAKRNDEFWLFLNQKDVEKETRIEFIFELLVGKPEDLEDKYFTFREYFKKFNNNVNVTDNWKEVKRHYQMLRYWFENRELYHKIGFLITFGKSNIIKNELIDPSQGEDKSNFVALIDRKIRETLKGVNLDDIEYGNGNIKKVLLLHNIQTMLNNKEENSRFPFDRYKKEEWDIEHIHAIATKMPKEQEQQKDWLKYAEELLVATQFDISEREIEKEKLLSRLGKYSEDKFEQIYTDILSFVPTEDVNSLSNLVLLDSGTNRGYKNEFFSYKRKAIIKKEKAGTFVPVCTKNVFMKSYSEETGQMSFWTEMDRNAYFEDIKKVLAEYLSVQKQGDNCE